MIRRRRSRSAASAPCRRTGQSLVEFALVFPIFAAFVFGTIVLGLAVFFQQQIANAAREGARYAAIHSSTAQCPTVSWLDPTLPNQPDSYFRCDPPERGWPRLKARTRSTVFGLDPSAVHVAACWSSYHDSLGNPDSPAIDPGSGAANSFVDCTIGGTNPMTNADSLACPPPATVPADDAGSDLANGTHESNRVVIYVCTDWQPPMAGFLAIPNHLTLRAVVAENVHRQQ